MSTRNLETGRWGEDLAAAFLVLAGGAIVIGTRRRQAD